MWQGAAILKIGEDKSNEQIALYHIGDASLHSTILNQKRKTDADMWLWLSFQQNSAMEATNCTFGNNVADFGAVMFAKVESYRLYMHFILFLLH